MGLVELSGATVLIDDRYCSSFHADNGLLEVVISTPEGVNLSRNRCRALGVTVLLCTLCSTVITNTPIPLHIQ